MKKCSSVVWQFFDRLEDNNRCVAVLCKLCDCEYKYFGNTTNLRAHLIKKHPIQWEMRQIAEDGKIEEPTTRPVTSTGNSSSSKRSKTQRPNKDNVCYTLSVATDSETTGDFVPQIEIQRVDVHDNHDDGDNEEVGTTNSLIEQMHIQASNEEWLDDDYCQVDMYDRKRKRIKRELVTPPRQRSSRHVHNSLTSDTLDRIVLGDSPVKDEYSVFGEYIANKLRKFKTPRTRGNIQQLITTILWQAEYGIYDDADAVKRVLMSPVTPVIKRAAMVETIADNKPEENRTKVNKKDMLENMDI